jgi:hypothetical protein
MGEQRVLGTQRALQAAQQQRSIIADRLQGDLRDLASCGKVLADPSQWDGAEASRFRSETWPQVNAGISRALPSLEQLQAQAEKVVQDILRAGTAGLTASAQAPLKVGTDPLLLAPGAHATLYYPRGAWADARDGKVTWGRPETLRDHVWGGPSRPNGPPHGSDFGVRTQGQYTRLATNFLQDAQARGYLVKVARNGSIRVYDPATNTFGAYGADGTTRTFFKPGNGMAYWNTQPGSAPTGTQLTDAVDGAKALEADARSSPLARIGGLMDSPAGRVVSRGLTGLAVVGDVFTIADPSPNALGGANLERTMAVANLGAMALTAAPVAELLAVNAATDWIPGVGEVVMAGTALYLAGDFVYQNREAIGHALSWADQEVAHVAGDVGHDVASGVSHAWHSIFG